MTNKVSFLVVMLAMVGCAGAAPQDQADMGTAATPQTLAPRIAANANSVATSSAAEVEMVDLALPVEVLGRPGAVVTACQEFQVPLSSEVEFTGHAPGNIDVTPKNVRGCAHSDDGMLDFAVAAHTQTVLRLIGPGFFHFFTQITTTGEARGMSEARLLSDDAIAAVYGRVDVAIDGLHTTVVIETPADDASVELIVNRTGEGPAPIYLDAAGSPTERKTSVAGGWAVFPNVPKGVHEAFMSHEKLTCTPDVGASWPGSHEGSVSLVALPDAISHTNAFGCR